MHAPHPTCNLYKTGRGRLGRTGHFSLLLFYPLPSSPLLSSPLLPFPSLPFPSALHVMSSTTTDLLSRRFGSETVNYYAGSRLNRYSFLRSDSRFLASAIASPSARFVVLDALAPLVVDRRNLAFLSVHQVRPLIGDDGLSDAAAPLVIFLGLAEGEEDAVEIETSNHGIVRGRPYFAIDATPQPPISEAARALLDNQAAQGISVLSDPRSMTFSPEAGEARRRYPGILPSG